MSNYEYFFPVFTINIKTIFHNKLFESVTECYNLSKTEINMIVEYLITNFITVCCVFWQGWFK